MAAGRAIYEEVGGEGGVEGRNAIDRVVLEPRHWIAAYRGLPGPPPSFGESPRSEPLTHCNQARAAEGTRYRTRQANGFPYLGGRSNCSIQATFFSRTRFFEGAGGSGRGGWRAK